MASDQILKKEDKQKLSNLLKSEFFYEGPTEWDEKVSKSFNNLMQERSSFDELLFILQNRLVAKNLYYWAKVGGEDGYT